MQILCLFKRHIKHILMLKCKFQQRNRQPINPFWKLNSREDEMKCMFSPLIPCIAPSTTCRAATSYTCLVVVAGPNTLSAVQNWVVNTSCSELGARTSDNSDAKYNSLFSIGYPRYLKTNAFKPEHVAYCFWNDKTKLRWGILFLDSALHKAGFCRLQHWSIRRHLFPPWPHEASQTFNVLPSDIGVLWPVILPLV